MKKSLLVLALAATFAPMVAQAEAGDWVVRLRAVSVNPNEDSNLGKYVNDINPAFLNRGAELAVDSNVIPELDISYYFTKNIAAELILALGTKHDVSVKGAAAGDAVQNQKLGSVDLLPPTLTLQWHFNPDQMIDPYVGAGVNYTVALDRNLSFSQALPGNDIKISKDSWGYALQAGVDINLKDGWLINADVKYLDINTNVEARLGANNTGAWTKIDDLDINPWVFGLGVGKKF
jgi:outer membrane protein